MSAAPRVVTRRPGYLLEAARRWHRYRPGQAFPVEAFRELALLHGPDRLDGAITVCGDRGDLSAANVTRCLESPTVSSMLQAQLGRLCVGSSLNLDEIAVEVLRLRDLYSADDVTDALRAIVKDVT